MNSYLEKFCDEKEQQHDIFSSLREYAVEHDVPIIKRDSLELIKMMISINKCYRILEIGTAIGYSALGFASVNDQVIVDTIERNEEMYQQAIKNIKLAKKEDKINVHFNDALEIDLAELKEEYDMIFIDAAKAQYVKFFEKFTPLLKQNGIVFTDNIVFHGCVENQENLSRNLRSMVKKIDLYNNFLKDKESFETFYLDSGDGLAVSIKVKQ